jgi:hypothetical protein
MCRWRRCNTECNAASGEEVAMPTQCPVCSQLNPDDARYCYYDGRPLSGEREQGPLHIGTTPFPTPFYFADGQACSNFNQLVLACVNRWDEARNLLTEGIWHAFFRNIGRLDLAAAAKHAAGDPDPDFGLSQLLERLPAEPGCLRPPKLAIESTEHDFGRLVPGTDCSFDLVIVNQGMLTLRGVIVVNGDWLVLGERGGPAQKMFQTRNFHTIRVVAVGSRLRAGLMPLEGEVVIESNGGTQTMRVHGHVPIQPFPQGVYASEVLAGACSPREIAKRAKEHAKQAAILFEQGAVKRWYESNGWTYPVEGSQGSGKGAVQQFFEALGLTKPPRVEIDTASLVFRASAGAQLSQSVTLRTEEAKPVYAQASSSQDWVRIGLIKYRGNQLRIPVEIAVPNRPGETVHAQVTIEGNGKQRFVIPVSVAIEQQGPGGTSLPVAAAAYGKAAALVAPAAQARAVGSSWWPAWLAAGCLVTAMLLVLGTLVVVTVVKVLHGGG